MEKHPGFKSRLNSLYTSALIFSFGENFAGGKTVGASFLNMFTVEMGATPTQLGLFHSITISIQSVFQILWGRLSDKIGKRIPLIVIGGLGYSILWVFILFSSTPNVLLGLLVVQAFFASIRLPNWTSLVGDLSPTDQRGVITANISYVSTIAGLGSIITAGIIMFYSAGSLINIYAIPFFAATIFGVIGTLFLLRINESKSNRLEKGEIRSSQIREFFNKLNKNKDFLKYLIVASASNTALVILLPVISIMTIRILNVDKITFAMYGVVRSLSMLVFQKRLGKIVDIAGRKQLMILQRIIYVIIPGLIVIAPNKYFIFIPYLILGVLHAIEGTANLSYLLDVTPHEGRGGFISIFNAIQGIGTFVSSLIGGILIELLSNRTSILQALRIVAIITTLLRIPTAFAYFSLKEIGNYPSNLLIEAQKRLFLIHSSKIHV